MFNEGGASIMRYRRYMAEEVVPESLRKSGVDRGGLNRLANHVVEGRKSQKALLKMLCRFAVNVCGGWI